MAHSRHQLATVRAGGGGRFADPRHWPRHRHPAPAPGPGREGERFGLYAP